MTFTHSDLAALVLAKCRLMGFIPEDKSLLPYVEWHINGSDIVAVLSWVREMPPGAWSCDAPSI